MYTTFPLIQGRKWLENEDFQSSSIVLKGTTYYLKDIVKFISNRDIYTGKLTKFFAKVNYFIKAGVVLPKP
jgi:hypothetical protein